MIDGKVDAETLTLVEDVSELLELILVDPLDVTLVEGVADKLFVVEAENVLNPVCVILDETLDDTLPLELLEAKDVIVGIDDVETVILGEPLYDTLEVLVSDGIVELLGRFELVDVIDGEVETDDELETDLLIIDDLEIVPVVLDDFEADTDLDEVLDPELDLVTETDDVLVEV